MTDEEKAVVFIKRYFGTYTEAFRNEMIPPLVKLIRDERKACAKILDVAAETAKNLGNFTDAQNLRAYAALIRARSS